MRGSLVCLNAPVQGVAQQWVEQKQHILSTGKHIRSNAAYMLKGYQLNNRVLYDDTKSRGWHTAFFYLAEHIRLISGGLVNHKILYSLVGRNGHYINHENPTVRKRTAAMLSRIVHSQRYVADFQASYADDPEVFDCASRTVVASIIENCSVDDAKLADLLIEAAWPDVSLGLFNEWEDGRVDLNLPRLNNEMQVFVSSCKASESSTAVSGKVLAAILYTITFGHLEEGLVYRLATSTPLEPPSGDCFPFHCDAGRACIIRYLNGDQRAISEVWVVEREKSFVVGRYTDCDAIETMKYVSRRHCRFFWDGESWRFEDLHSRYGSRVIRGNTVVFDSELDHERQPIRLRHGDRIVLARGAHYWFGAFCGESLRSMGA